MGGGTLSGSVSMPAGCVGFDIESGGGSYNLDAGEFHIVTVKFRPLGYGEYQCTVETGTDCANVTVHGSGVPGTSVSGD